MQFGWSRNRYLFHIFVGQNLLEIGVFRTSSYPSWKPAQRLLPGVAEGVKNPNDKKFLARFFPSIHRQSKRDL